MVNEKGERIIKYGEDQIDDDDPQSKEWRKKNLFKEQEVYVNKRTGFVMSEQEKLKMNTDQSRLKWVWMNTDQSILLK
jgi:hypothetical protein